MKRVKAACICQTLHFMLKEDIGHDYAVSLVKQEVAQYKKGLDNKHTQYKIVEETGLTGRFYHDKNNQTAQFHSGRQLSRLTIAVKTTEPRPAKIQPRH